MHLTYSRASPLQGRLSPSGTSATVSAPWGASAETTNWMLRAMRTANWTDCPYLSLTNLLEASSHSWRLNWHNSEAKCCNVHASCEHDTTPRHAWSSMHVWHAMEEHACKMPPQAQAPGTHAHDPMTKHARSNKLQGFQHAMQPCKPSNMYATHARATRQLTSPQVFCGPHRTVVV